MDIIKYVKVEVFFSKILACISFPQGENNPLSVKNICPSFKGRVFDIPQEELRY